MKQIIFIFLLFLICFDSVSQNHSSDLLSCREGWKYLTTTHSIKGELLYFLPTGDCGYSLSATLSIIKVANGDTIRVLQMCDTTKEILPNTQVTLLPNKEATKKSGIIIPVDKINDCRVRDTYLGRLRYL